MTEGTEYSCSRPIKKRIELVNELFDRGAEVIIFTARGTLTGTDHRELTEHQLKDWGVKYHRLEFGKPAADKYIDDRAVSDLDFFT